MVVKIENRLYTYLGDDVCAISATMNVYADDRTTIIASTGLSAQYNITHDDYVAEITRQLLTQAQAYLVKMAYLDQQRQARVPDSTSFADAINRIIDPIQTALGG